MPGWCGPALPADLLAIMATSGPPSGASSAVASNAPAGPPPGVIAFINLRCRMVDLKGVSADANTKFAYMLEKALSSSPKFVAGAARFGQLEPAGDNLTFKLQVTLTLKNPLKL